MRRMEKDNVICLFSGSVVVLSALLELTHSNSLKPSRVDIVIPSFEIIEKGFSPCCNLTPAL